MKRFGFYMLLFNLLAFSLFSSSILSVKAEEPDQLYESIVNQYYELINTGYQNKITDLYGSGLNDFVSEFFSNEYNKQAHRGIYNVQDTEILSIKKVDSISSMYDDAYISYTNVVTYFIKCHMNVYSSDKYYTQGNNYFLFYIGIDPNSKVKIVNIEIPTFDMIEFYDDQVDDILLYEQTRMYYLYGDIPTPASDAPIYIDYVKNPRKIRVLYNGSSKEIDFDEYCLTVAANEINTLKSTDGLRAAAMAVKMFGMHYVNCAASGSDYDINSTVQKYKEGVQISKGAEDAMNYIMDYFLLDYYGANFKTFYRTKESDNPYCKQYGGILAQKDGDTMGSNGKTWQDILKFYYTRVSNVDYYNPYMNYGNIIIAPQHTHDWSGGITCSYCGAIAK